MSIDKFNINSEKCIIIAEAGINHNGDMNTALLMIEAAAEAGANVIKFQTISGETDYNYAKRDNEVYHFIKKASFNKEQYLLLKEKAKECEIKFLSSVADVPSARLLNEIGVSAFKVSSGNFTNYHLLKELSKYKIPVIISTGMSDFNEICETYNYMKKLKIDEIAFLYCLSQYPADLKNIDFSIMTSMMKMFSDITVGFSDHTCGTLTAVIARTLGASMIEKHFTIDRNMPGPDQKFSLQPEELVCLVRQIRDTEEVLFSQKMSNAGEEENKIKLRRSMYANKDIEAGNKINFDDIAAKRPFNRMGVNPKFFEEVVGATATQRIMKNELITERMFTVKEYDQV